ncbi:MAG: A/G-specific adenine glycosylase [Alphaproteobacteria bacterium]|nr:A/G-specific adenine glycosylase [Alphaproteobacteria bacterium]
MKKSHVIEWDTKDFQQKVMDWYGKNARDLPWRMPRETKKAVKPNPYHVWLSEIMLQQTTVLAVKSYFEKFTHLWPTLADLAHADEDAVMREWAGLGYYARARNLIKCAREVFNHYDGAFPRTEKELLKLPGIGRYTAAAILSIAFHQESVVVDGNIERITSRLFMIEEPLPQSKKTIYQQASIIYDGIGCSASDMPQALMDIGATICTPKSPKCSLCPVCSYCQAFHFSEPEKYPHKASKLKKPSRVGEVYWIETENQQIVVEKRGGNRMLGNMAGLPGTNWDGYGQEKIPDLDWQRAGEITHVFTHFSLKLTIMKGKIRSSMLILNKNQYLVDINNLGDVGFPSLFRKVIHFVSTLKEVE